MNSFSPTGNANESGTRTARPIGIGSVESEHDLLMLQSSVLNNMLEGVCMSDEAGCILYTNAALDRLFGYGPGELVGCHVTALNAYSPEENKRRVAEVIDCLQRTGAWSGEWLNRAKNGDKFQTASRISAVELAGRKFWVSVQSEISGDKYREAESRRLAAIVESSEDAIITKDLNGVITSWNRGAERIFGYTAQEAVGQPVSMLAAPHRLNEMPDILGRLKLGHPIEHYETERRTKDGRTISVSLTVSPLRNGTGEVIGASKIARDITESKRIRGDLAQREREYATLLANLPDIVTRVDRDLRITFTSDAVRTFSGRHPDYYIGKTHAELGIPRELALLVQTALREVLASGNQQTIEFDLRDPSGVLRHYLSVSVPERIEGCIAGALTITRDITERRLAERAQLAVENELMLLVEASSAVIASPRSAEVLQTILNLASRFISADAYGVWRRTGDEWVLMVSEGVSAEYASASIQASAMGPEIPRAITIEDVFTDPVLANRAELYRKEGIRSILIVPLWIHGVFSGTVVFYWRQPHKSSQANVRIGTALGNLAASALGISDLYEEETKSRLRAERSERRSKFLARAGALLSSSLDYNATLNNVAELAVPDFADWCSADVVNEQGEFERITIHHRDPAMLDFAAEYRRKYPPREDDARRVAVREGKSFLIPEVSQEQILSAARSEEHLDTLFKLQLRSIIVVPMMVGTEALGVISFISSDPNRRYDEADLEVAEELARRAGTAIAHARLYAHVRESEERLRLAITAAKLGVWENDRLSGVLTCSEQCKRNIGFAPDEDVTYQALADRMHPDDRVAWRQQIESALKQRTPFEAEYRVILPNGSEKWVLSYGQAIYSPEGVPLRTVGVTMDVTENRSLLLREKEARRTAELLNGLGPVLLAELNPRNLIHRVVGTAAQLLGARFGVLFYRPQNNTQPLLYSFSGIDRTAFDALPDAERQRLAQLWFRSTGPTRLADLAPESSPFAGLTSNVRAFLAVPIRSRNGQVVGGLLFGDTRPGVFHQPQEDILTGIAAQASIALENARLFETARATQEALRFSNEELRRANEDLNQFAYSASHDLQEPLRMVAIYSQMLSRRYESLLDDKGRDYLRFTVQGARRMEMLVKDLLAYTQAGSAAGEQIEVVDPVSALKQSLQNLKGSIDENSAVITIDGALPPLRVQEVHLMQLFQNLIGNAIKYRNGEQVPQIVVSGADTGSGMAEFRVQDNGIGIPARYQKQVFGLFKRLHSGDKYAGTGIGLAICQRIVERYGGRIWVESQEGQGSAFHFTLPSGEATVLP